MWVRRVRRYLKRETVLGSEKRGLFLHDKTKRAWLGEPCDSETQTYQLGHLIYSDILLPRKSLTSHMLWTYHPGSHSNCCGIISCQILLPFTCQLMRPNLARTKGFRDDVAGICNERGNGSHQSRRRCLGVHTLPDQVLVADLPLTAPYRCKGAKVSRAGCRILTAGHYCGFPPSWRVESEMERGSPGDSR